MEDIRNLLIRNNQEHILKILELCNDSQKENLIKQIRSIDFKQVSSLYSISKKLNDGSSISNRNSEIEPIRVVDKYNIDEEYSDKLIMLGENIIKSGKYAVVTMAGRTRNKARP